MPGIIWRMPSKSKDVYLTFDDGPSPGITEYVLETLKKNNASATFFCIGKNIQKYTALYDQIVTDGHAIGNHTFNHVNGWKTTSEEYINDINAAGELMDTKLFRPPYGKITPLQAKKIMRHYKLVMWDLLSYDFDNSVSPEKCLQNVMNNIKPGSVVVFHDSIKASKNLKYVLPKIFDKLNADGYSFKNLSALKKD
jgi:peptidoglycan/xylan/chitin deacetylase (PgdA/CDA1 family)